VFAGARIFKGPGANERAAEHMMGCVLRKKNVVEELGIARPGYSFAARFGGGSGPVSQMMVSRRRKSSMGISILIGDSKPAGAGQRRYQFNLPENGHGCGREIVLHRSSRGFVDKRLMTFNRPSRLRAFLPLFPAGGRSRFRGRERLSLNESNAPAASVVCLNFGDSKQPVFFSDSAHGIIFPRWKQSVKSVNAGT